ncbi:MAG: MFS transporter, partial [Reyranella sp.]
DDRLGSRRIILLALAGLIIAGAAAASVQTRPWLWLTGGFLGIFVGPVQASSRALMARLAPADRQAEYFGLLALSGRATSFLGPTVAAIVTDATGSQRIGLATILAFLIAGFGLLATGGRDDNG